VDGSGESPRDGQGGPGGRGHTVVVGTGRMAPGIAAAFAAAGDAVTIVGRSTARAEAAAARARAHVDEDRPRSQRHEAVSAGSPVVASAGLEPAAFAGATLVVETVTEDRAVKHQLLARIGGWWGEDTLVVTNTSSLSITDLADAVPAPERFAGLHFLNPAHLTTVVEVVRGARTADDTAARLVAAVERLGKQPILVERELAGFVWNRIQMAVLRECLYLLETGIADAAAIDAAVADGLAPRWTATGPLATADVGGIHTFAAVAAQVFPTLSNQRDVPDVLRRAVAAGGFHGWTEDARRQAEQLRAETLTNGASVARRRRSIGLGSPEGIT
jgi:3-hydroxybutyryl-CoA dehydrogenase